MRFAINARHREATGPSRVCGRATHTSRVVFDVNKPAKGSENVKPVPRQLSRPAPDISVDVSFPLKAPLFLHITTPVCSIILPFITHLCISPVPQRENQPEPALFPLIRVTSAHPRRASLVTLSQPLPALRDHPVHSTPYLVQPHHPLCLQHPTYRYATHIGPYGVKKRGG